ncbi:YchJ family protein [Marinobacterium sediminicola]|uniref:SEC-C motif-containing protein n=1 Tax=Marinobacterium sediminicola TaxID=518898 RepID=A0ABY1RWQ9_9GAMM|nr:YchJ family protein [Marinobacterium sediminicola]ULG70241.1 YchJ family protein [Marinobacterium sediminicola]SMR69998.1 SEC-C motif-containing protein [Marinobacterium sediminicola]
MLTDNKDLDTRCPCGSGKPFSFCCEPAISGRKPAATAEALMRSRYTAFVLGAIDYLINTTASRKRNPRDAELLSEQTQVTTWTGLEILDTVAGSASDQSGVVEFKAAFDSPEGSAILHERSRFEREEGHWVYTDGDVELLPA